MKNITIAIFILFLTVFTIKAQDCDLNSNTITIDTLCPEIANQLIQGSATIAARDAVVLKPGFAINASNVQSHSLTVKVDHAISNQVESYISSSSGENQLPPTADYAPITMGGEINVSPSGGALYQIPIQVSPGSNGMQPNISIVYSSQSGNGILGWGWNLAGLSAISRVGSNMYYDNTISPIKYNDLDAFALNGVRLIKHSDEFYYPSNDPYTQIEFVNSQKFKVTTQDGVIMEFGYTEYSPNSQFKGVNATVPYTYALSRITDTNGNYIEYLYSNNSTTGEYQISEIKYTGNSISGKAPYNSVKFFYSTRNDINSLFVTGHKITQASILKEIKVYCEGALSKNYQFTYAYSDNSLYSKLRMVTLTADGIVYSPITINWDEFDYSLGEIFASYIENSTMKDAMFFVGDVNGDGITDIIKYNQLYGELKVYYGGSISSKVIKLFENHNTPYVVTKNIVKEIKVVDVNSDGKDNILVHYASNITDESSFGNPVYSSYDIVVSYTYNSENGSYNRMPINHEIICEHVNSPCENQNKYSHYFADITNNGTSNHIIVESNLLKSISNLNIGNLGSLIGEFEDVLFLDFNGDGRLDLLFLKENGEGSIWTFSEEQLGLKEILPTTFITKNKNLFFPGDFNGDGKTDYLGITLDNNWVMMYSTGIGFVNQSLPQGIDFSSIPGSYSHQKNLPPDVDMDLYLLQKKRLPSAAITVDDINNDGKSDVVYVNNDKLFIALNNGNNFHSQLCVTFSDLYTQGGNLYMIYTLDTDGDGKREILYGMNKYYFSHASGYNYKIFNSIEFDQNIDKGLYVNSLIDGAFNESSITYNYYSNSLPHTNVFPIALLRGPMKVVSNLKTITKDSQTIADITYSYGDGSIHLQGLGFLGFKNFTVEDGVSKQRSRTQFKYTTNGAPGIYSPWPELVETFRDNIPISTSLSTLELIGVDLNKKFFWPVMVKANGTNHLTGVTTNQDNTWDNTKGRLQNQTTSFSNSSWSSAVSYNYVSVYGKTSKIQGVSSITISPKGSFNHAVSYTYDTGNPFRVRTSTAQGFTTTYDEFDAYGNVTRVTKGGRTNIATFDSKGRFVETATDYGGFTSQVAYRYSNGVKLSEVSPRGLTTSYSYQAGASIVTTISLPDGNAITKKLEWINGKMAYKLTESVTNGNTITEEFNLAGQRKKQTYLGFGGALRTKEFEYFPDGTLKSESHPGVTSPTTYSYFSDGRIRSITDFTDVSTTFTYTGLDVERKNLILGAEVTTHDVLGNVVKASGNRTGTVEYFYNAMGKVDNIKTNRLTTSMAYDIRGNQLTLSDPSAGVTTYEYNEFNELILQKDAEGYSTSIVINDNTSKGRIEAINGSDYSISYQYYDNQYKKGLLKEAERNGVTEKYEYDDLGRPTKIVVSGASKSFTTLYEYGSEGRLEYTTYPTGLKVKYVYDAVGNLTQINDVNRNIALWQGEKDSRDMWEKFTYGNGIITKYMYNSSTLMLENIMAGNPRTPASVYNIDLHYNSERQIDSRKQDGLKEVFEYSDGKNRLTSSTVQGKQPFVVEYDDNGNITSTSQSGEYSYNIPAKPYAVAEVANPAWQSAGLSISISYTGDKRIAEISNSSFKEQFVYSPSGQRFKVDQFAGTALQRSKIYVGPNEFILDPGGNIIEMRTFIFAPTGICAVHSKVGSNNPVLSYIHTDHLGSWIAMTDELGFVAARQSFDAWGRPRNPNTWDLLPVDLNNPTQAQALQPSAFFDRGYTGHEHMCGFGLINMNGRVYDPYLQRFLSPDPYVQEPANAQNYNRYTYCLNNPLMYTDPSGYQSIDYFAELSSNHWGNGGGGMDYGWGYSPMQTTGSTFGFFNSWAGFSSVVSQLMNSAHGGNWSAGAGITFFRNEAEARWAGYGYRNYHRPNSKNTTFYKSGPIRMSSLLGKVFSWLGLGYFTNNRTDPYKGVFRFVFSRSNFAGISYGGGDSQGGGDRGLYDASTQILKSLSYAYNYGRGTLPNSEMTRWKGKLTMVDLIKFGKLDNNSAWEKRTWKGIYIGTGMNGVEAVLKADDVFNVDYVKSYDYGNYINNIVLWLESSGYPNQYTGIRLRFPNAASMQRAWDYITAPNSWIP